MGSSFIILTCGGGKERRIENEYCDPVWSIPVVR